MVNQEFRTIHEIGYSSLLEKLDRYRGAYHDKIDHDKITLRLQGSGTAISLKPDDNDLLLTASVIYVEGVHFDLVYTPLQHLGYKSMTAVISKIYAMNAHPAAANIALGVPNKLSVEMLQTIYKGFDRAGKDSHSAVVTGDITASQQVLAFSVHITGFALEKQVVGSQGCFQGDQICVTGDLGGAMAGLRILLREKKAWQESGEEEFQPELQNYEYVVERQLMPKSRRDLIISIGESGVKPTSMIELSKGLLNEIQIVTASSGVGCEIFLPAIPIVPETRQVADEMKEDVDRYALYGGEEYEMLFTLVPEDVEKLRTEFEDFTVIGEIRPEKEGIRINRGGGEVEELRENNL